MSISIACSCGLNTILNKESIGKKILCKNCNEILDNFIKPNPAIFGYSNNNVLPEISSPQYEISCPFCIEKIPNTSKICSFCGEQLNGAIELSHEQTSSLLSEHFAKLKANNSQENFKSRRFTAGSYALIMITCLFLTGLLTSVFEKPFDSESVVIFGIITSLFACFTIIYYLNDRKARKMQYIKSPIKFFTVFFNCLKDHRVIFSYQSVSLLGRATNSTRLLPFVLINIDTKQYDITNLKGFKKYWRSTLIGAGMYGRVMKIDKIKLLKEFDNVAVLEISLKLQSYDVAISVGKKNESATIKKILLKHDSKWFVAEGELQGNLDFATFKEGV